MCLKIPDLHQVTSQYVDCLKALHTNTIVRVNCIFQYWCMSIFLRSVKLSNNNMMLLYYMKQEGEIIQSKRKNL